VLFRSLRVSALFLASHVSECGRSKKRPWSGCATLHEPDFLRPSG